MMPIEYSVAAYRFGHSMIRGEYEVHDQLTCRSSARRAHDLRGSRPFPPDLRIDWNYFFELPGVNPPDDRNLARLIDTQLSMPLAALPPTVVAPAADAITALAARNLLRGKMLGLPSGQDVAKKMGIAPAQQRGPRPHRRALGRRGAAVVLHPQGVRAAGRPAARARSAGASSPRSSSGC